MAPALGIRAVEAGEELGILFAAHRQRILRVAYRITGSMADAEDIAQAVFLRLLQNAAPGMIDHPDSYLYRAAINASLDLLRQRKQQNQTPLETALSVAAHPDTSPEHSYSETELRSWLRQALGKLGPRAAEAFVLRYLEDHDNRTIARIQNTSQAVVAVVLFRARTRLRQELKNFMRGQQ